MASTKVQSEVARLAGTITEITPEQMVEIEKALGKGTQQSVIDRLGTTLVQAKQISPWLGALVANLEKVKS